MKLPAIISIFLPVRASVQLIMLTLPIFTLILPQPAGYTEYADLFVSFIIFTREGWNYMNKFDKSQI